MGARMAIGETLFNCKIQLSKTGGISISIKDLSQPTQVYKQIVMDNDSLIIKTNKQTSSSTITQIADKVTTQVTTDAGTTTIEQGPEEIKVTCKRFIVDAESIEMKSKEDTTHTATGKYTINSTKDYTLSSSAKCSLSSDSDMSLTTQAKGSWSAPTAQVSVSSPKVELTAQTSLTAESGGALSVKGGAVSIKGDTRAELSSPQTKVGNAMTTVEGSIVSIAGSLVKIG